MGIGSGIFLIALGAALSWAVDVDLPYVEDDAIGLILVLVGIVAVMISAILNTDHPEAGLGTGALLFATGAVLSWAIQIDVPYIADYAMGTIMMIAGSISILATLVMTMQRRRDQQRYQDRNYYGSRPPLPDRY